LAILNFEPMNIQIINKSPYPLPTYKTGGSAGMDIHANIETPRTIPSGEYQLIPTGLYLSLPDDMECQVRPRSGLALKQGLTVLNAPGTIDSDYRGEIGVILINHANTDVSINPGDRIAQIVFCPIVKVTLDEVLALDSSSRGENGFGSTGIK